MSTNSTPHPPIVSREQWLAEQKKLLADEKEQTKHYDRVNAQRRRFHCGESQTIAANEKRR
jgi:predicted dithiol-disulfide oxidoreductase (DUF899 family)